MDFEVLISADDIRDEGKMREHRLHLDAGAKAHSSVSKFDHEEIAPYVIEVRQPDGTTRKLAESPDTRKYRILRRFYE